ncbi:MAG: hypothetical protein NWP83_04200 [Spirosomaceae bacterium]|nr:hypothetical protein [Spirosomataceae bacterium]
MILLKNVKLPKINGIALWPFVIVRSKAPGKIILNHERIHLRQQIEMLIVFFYVWYIIEWGINYVKFGNWWAAYYAISFEREAYDNEQNLDYLKQRKFWAFSGYLKRNKL